MLCLILRTVREKYNINVSINHLQTKSIAIYQAERELINHWSDYKCRSGLCSALLHHVYLRTAFKRLQGGNRLFTQQAFIYVWCSCRLKSKRAVR